MYIREAHALDSNSPAGGNGMPIVEDPITLFERQQVAQVCMTKLELEGIPALVDDMKDTANQAYRAWPDRLYLVGKDGKIAYHGGRGPFGFKPEELTAAMDAELKKNGVPVPKAPKSVDIDSAEAAAIGSAAPKTAPDAVGTR